MMMKLPSKKFIIIALVLFLLVGGGLAMRQRSASSRASTAITTAKVQRANFVNAISSSGKTAADKSVELKFQTSGRLAWVGVAEGDYVNAYQVIATLDVREVQKNLEKALRDYSLERNDFEEARQVTYGFKQPTDVNDTIKRILEKNQWDLEKAVLDVELKSLALEFSRLVTPIAGVVTHIDTPIAGVNITPATAVFAVSDPTSLVFEANVDETDVGSLSIGQTATIMLDAFPEATFSGSISFISYSSEQSSGGATVFPVKIAFDDPQNVFRIGLNGDIQIETERQDDVLTIPTEAVREDTDGAYVYRKSDGKYETVRVATGAKSEEAIIVTSGLAEGDTVVTKGFTALPK
jgi:macrolide-specific efflux system membrane fusion protein